MTIGELARRAGVNVETIRYYERRGLLPPPERAKSGYRLYRPDAIARVGFIKRGQGLGFTLHEIADLLALRTRPDASCNVVDRKAREKIATIRRRMQDLRVIEQRLARVASECDATGPVARCPILHHLEAAEVA